MPAAFFLDDPPSIRSNLLTPGPLDVREMAEIILAGASVLRQVEEALDGSIRVVPAANYLSSHNRIVGAEGPHDAAPEIDVGRDIVLAAILGDDPGLRDSKVILEGLDIPVLTALDGVDLRAWVTSTVLDKLRDVRGAAADERRASAILRSEYMDLQDKFADLESFFRELGSPPYSVALSFPETPDEVLTAALSDTESSEEVGRYTFELRQALPISLVGVSAVALYLTRLPEERNQPLRLSFEDAGRQVGVIEAGWGDVSLGWNSFRLAKALPHLCADASLVVRCDLDQRDAAGFGLAPPAPLQRLHLATNGLCPPGSMLALKVYRGIPGLSVPAVHGSLPHGRTAPDRSTVLLPSHCPRPEIFEAPAERESFVHVDYWANENAIMVHGTTSGPVTAVIRNIAVENVLQVTASVNSLHKESPVLGFRFSVAPAGTPPDPDRVAADWTVLLPGQWGEARAILDEPYTGALDFYMTVSVTNKPRSSNWAWGLFRAFRLQSASGAPQG